MSRRVQAVRGHHMHAAWESQPLVQSTARPARRGCAPVSVVAAAFLIGLLMGLMF